MRLPKSLAVALAVVFIAGGLWIEMRSQPSMAPVSDLAQENLAGNYTIIDDVNGLALVGFKPPYDGAEDDHKALNTYINTSYYSEIGLLNLEEGLGSLEMLGFQGETLKVNGEPVGKAPRLTQFLQPCYSAEDQRIYQLAHRHREGRYNNAGERVLLSITPEGVYEVFTVDILGTGYIEGYDPFYLSAYRGCQVEIAPKYTETLGKTCSELDLSFSCYEAPGEKEQIQRFEMQEIDFSKAKSVQLIASAEYEDDWPLEVKVRVSGNEKKLSLPQGPFVQDSGFFKQLSCLSCGCGCYQHLDLNHIDGDYYLTASGWAIDDRYRGIYKLKDEAEWEYVSPLPKTARSFTQIGECSLAWEEGAGEDRPFENKQVSWVNLCHPE